MRIEIEKARKRFGKVEVLKGIDLVIPAGRRVALVGPNGSGKSTLIRALLGLIDCEGRLLIDGRSPYENRVALAQRLAYVPQVAPALGATVRELIGLVTLTRGLAKDAIAGTAGGLGLDVAAVAQVPFRNLSGGMKQKLLLATAFAAKPELLVMDEPTASLDARARDRFFALCEGLKPEVTLVLCSHRLEELQRLAKHVVALDDGQLRFDGPVGGFLDAAEPGAGPRAHLFHGLSALPPAPLLLNRADAGTEEEG